MNKKTAISIGLSQEELLVILSYLNVENILGLDLQIVSQLSKSELNLVMGVAERALIARGYLIPDKPSNRFKLLDTVNAVVRACTNPDQTLSINCRYANQPEEIYYFHLSRKMAVFHVAAMTAVHQFTALESQSALLQSAYSTFNLGNTTALNHPEVLISEDVLSKAREVSKNGSEEKIVDTLSVSNMDVNIAKDFARSLANPVLNHTIVHIAHQANGDGQVGGFALLKGSNALWMLKPAGGNTKQKGMVSIMSVSEDQVANSLKKTLILS